jgi:hypothetical protein
VLGKVDEVGDVSCDWEKHLVTFKAKDGKAAVAGWEALKKAGYGGEFKQDDKDDAIVVTGRPIRPGKADEITFQNVHVCCQGCEKAIKEAVKDGEVTFEGTGQQKTVLVKGKDLSIDAVTVTLWKAGYSGELAK